MLPSKFFFSASCLFWNQPSFRGKQIFNINYWFVSIVLAGYSSCSFRVWPLFRWFSLPYLHSSHIYRVSTLHHWLLGPAYWSEIKAFFGALCLSACPYKLFLLVTPACLVLPRRGCLMSQVVVNYHTVTGNWTQSSWRAFNYWFLFPAPVCVFLRCLVFIHYGAM